MSDWSCVLRALREGMKRNPATKSHAMTNATLARTSVVQWTPSSTRENAIARTTAVQANTARILGPAFGKSNQTIAARTANRTAAVAV